MESGKWSGDGSTSCSGEGCKSTLTDAKNWVYVAGHSCFISIVTHGLTLLACEVSNNADRRPKYGYVLVSIDNHTTISHYLPVITIWNYPPYLLPLDSNFNPETHPYPRGILFSRSTCGCGCVLLCSVYFAMSFEITHSIYYCKHTRKF